MVSLQINAVAFRFLAFYRAMVCCQPALATKMNNTTVMMSSLVMTSSVYMCQELEFLLPRVSCPYSNTRYITNLLKSVIFIVHVQLDRYSDERDLIFM